MKHKYIALIAGLVLPIVALAHPGGTASDGCHYCRTNCSSWGEVYGERHCHGGGGGGYRAPAAPSCPVNAYRNGDSCKCKYGYAPSLDRARCIRIPANAHEGNGITDVWECNYGYIESGNKCIPETKSEPRKEEVTESEPAEINKSMSQEDDQLSARELEKLIEELRNEIQEVAKEDENNMDSFVFGAASMAGGYWLYKRRRARN